MNYEEAKRRVNECEKLMGEIDQLEARFRRLDRIDPAFAVISQDSIKNVKLDADLNQSAISEQKSRITKEVASLKNIANQLLPGTYPDLPANEEPKRAMEF